MVAGRVRPRSQRQSCRRLHVASGSNVFDEGASVPLGTNYALRQTGPYPFSAPAIIPSMKRRWKRRKMITIGRVPKNEPAITAPYSWL